jgi:hypothetical protein
MERSKNSLRWPGSWAAPRSKLLAIMIVTRQHKVGVRESRSSGALFYSGQERWDEADNAHRSPPCPPWIGHRATVRCNSGPYGGSLSLNGIVDLIDDDTFNVVHRASMEGFILARPALAGALAMWQSVCDRHNATLNHVRPGMDDLTESAKLQGSDISNQPGFTREYFLNERRDWLT